MQFATVCNSVSTKSVARMYVRARLMTGLPGFRGLGKFSKNNTSHNTFVTCSDVARGAWHVRARMRLAEHFVGFSLHIDYRNRISDGERSGLIKRGGADERKLWGVGGQVGHQNSHLLNETE
ncbi:hypothetical protein EVAR_44952_1 [Eumeta japonica]|uniref:Uncharacterized protein n=1 Tax=Eumeta variegata TaxID=151549 RepID=A0A4C1W6E1_EUMVA|nr:hypothetical protein EVAR_44952_1 [Eumeta japonica]